MWSLCVLCDLCGELCNIAKRYCENQIAQDLKKKMVFLGGPRLVGKTTLSKQLIGPTGEYFNWDVEEERQAILKKQ